MKRGRPPNVGRADSMLPPPPRDWCAVGEVRRSPCTEVGTLPRRARVRRAPRPALTGFFVLRPRRGEDDRTRGTKPHTREKSACHPLSKGAGRFRTGTVASTVQSGAFLRLGAWPSPSLGEFEDTGCVCSPRETRPVDIDANHRVAGPPLCFPPDRFGPKRTISVRSIPRDLCRSERSSRHLKPKIHSGAVL